MVTVLPTTYVTGQSVQATNVNAGKPAFDIASISPSGPVPQSALDGPNPNGQSNILRFPDDTPPYYLTLSVNQYSRQSWREVGTLTERGRIILPLPREMIDNHNIRYDIEPLGIAGSLGFDAIGALNAGDASQLGSLATRAGVGLAETAAGQAVGAFGALGGASSNAGKGVLGAAGIAVNDFMTVMLKGPEYKRRDFIWRFSPRTASETSSLRRIIQYINNCMAPSITQNLGSAFFTWPRIWQPTFTWGGDPQLLSLTTFRMKPSVITDFNVNYTPNGVFAPFASTKAPSSVDIRISFLELEFWLSGQFNDTPTIANPDIPQTIDNLINLVKNTVAKNDASNQNSTNGTTAGLPGGSG